MGAGRAIQHGCAFLHAAALEAHRRQAASAFGETVRECESIYRFGKGARGRAKDVVGIGVHDARLNGLASVLHLKIGWRSGATLRSSACLRSRLSPLRCDCDLKKYFSAACESAAQRDNKI